MRGPIRSLLVLSTFVAGMPAALVPGDVSAAAPKADTMCGTGEPFHVYLDGKRMEDDPATKDLVNRAWPDAQIDLPKGCDVYAIIVHGYGRNEQLDELMFYKLARWVAQHNGYVHWSWWNNFLGPYMSGPLHGDSRAPRLTPGDVLDNAWDFLRGGVGKAVPDDDYQFQSDAKKVLERIREENPEAIIIVAGHSMGGNAVARLGSDTTVAIDLLAPIDPVGNRNWPRGDGSAQALGEGKESADPSKRNYSDHNKTFNWTRWRAVFDFHGWEDRDCIRSGIHCIDYDPNPFRTRYECRTRSTNNKERRKEVPVAEKACPDLISYSRVRFGPNIRRLYHRWQKEAYFPYDWTADYVFSLPSIPRKQDVDFDVSYRNYQSVLPEYDSASDVPPPTARHPLSTCRFFSKDDPGGAESFEHERLKCRDWDGHGEIIGMRGTKARNAAGYPPVPSRSNLNPLALTADWSVGDWDRESPWDPVLLGAEKGNPECGSSDKACRRRRALVRLALEDPPWRFAPKNPDLDLVVDDLVAIAEDLWANRNPGDPPGPDTTPPVSSTIVEPAATPSGWHRTDVSVWLAAVDGDGGSGVREIAYTLSGASSGGAVVPLGEFELQLSAEGVTTVEFYATDNAGNAEEPQTLEVRIDKTPPLLSAGVGTPPNEHDWHNTDVTVTFTASDELSGIDTVSDPLTLGDEGAEQEAVGVATDRAGNSANVGVVVNIDKTPPEIKGLPGSCELRPATLRMVKVADVVISDALAGVATTTLNATSSEPATGPRHGRTTPDIVISGGAISLRAERYAREGRTYDLGALATDLAGNSAQGSAVCRVPYDQRTRWPPETGAEDAASPAPVKPAPALRPPSPAAAGASP